MKNHGTIFTFGFSVVLIILAAFMAKYLMPYFADEETGFQPDSVQIDSPVAAQLVKELKFSMADMMWLKTEEYIHDGIQHRRKEKDADHEDHAHKEEDYQYQEQGHGLKHDHGTTLIPSKEDDFRGILGDIQRETQPYVRGHKMGSNLEELLPWLRLTTLANPHHIAAHRATAFFLASYMNKPAVAIETIQDALKLNPDNPQLLLVLGRLHFYDRKDPRKAEEIFKSVIAHWEESDRDWDEDDRFATMQAYLHAGYCHEAKRESSEAVQWATRGLREFPEYRPLSRLIARISRKENS